MKEIIEQLEAERALQNISYEKVAEQMESTRGVVYKVLTQKVKPQFETILGIAKVLGYKLELVKELQEGDQTFERTDRGIKHSVVKEGKEVAVNPDLKLKAKDISKIDLVKRAKAVAVTTQPNSTYSCGCKVEDNLFKRNKECKLAKQQHKLT